LAAGASGVDGIVEVFTDALGVGDVQPLSIRANGETRGIPTGGDAAEQFGLTGSVTSITATALMPASATKSLVLSGETTMAFG
jgi:hypothetical protein